MEEDIDIYADLPGFNLKTEQNDPHCKCNELRKELSSLTSQLKNTKDINENLERNMASLLKTAKAEIARKDKIIDDLRKELDSVIFRRNNGGPLSFSTHGLSYQRRAVVKEEQNVASPSHLKESEFILHTESHDDEHENEKPQDDVVRKPVTLFGERLKKRLMEDKIEEKQKVLSKLSTETDMKKISEECIVESDKENGSHTTVVNAKLNSTARNSSSAVSCERNSEKRPNSEDDTCRSSKRLKTNNKEDEANGSADNNYIAQYNIKDNFMQYETKEKSAKFDCLDSDAAHSFKKKQIPLDTTCRAVSEHKETRQDKNCTNELRRDQRDSSVKNYDSSRTRKGSTDNLRNSRAASTSNERSNNDYLRDYRVKNYRKNNDYRHNSPSSRSYSRSRSDYESSSNHRLERKSSRTYINKKYENSKYDNRYRNDVLRRGHKSKENDSDKTRYNSKEHNNLWNKHSHSPSEIKDKEDRSNPYKNTKCASRKVKEVTRNISESRKFHESDKTAMENDLQVFSSRTIVNRSTTEDNTHSVKKSIEQHGQTAKNESYNVSATPTENVLAINRERNMSPEDGEILDSPEKINISKFSKERATERSVANIIEDKYDKKSVSTCNSVIFKIDTVNTEELKKKVDIVTREAEISKIVSSVQTNEDSEKAKQLNSIDEKTITIDKVHNNSSKDMCKSYFDKKLTDTTNQEVTTVDQINDNSTDDNNFQKHAVENLKSSTIESIAKIEKEVSNPNNENVAKNEVSDANVESMTIKNVNTSNNDTRKTDTEQLESFTQETEIVPNCYIQNNIDKNCVTIKNKTAFQIPDKNNIKMNHSYLCDHNYVRNASIDICNLDTICKTSNQMSLECRKAVSEVATMKEVKKEETVNTQLANSVKKTISTIKSKKEQQKKAVVILRRRRAVTLSDNNASMTVVMNTNTVKAPTIVNNNSVDNDSVLKPRACKLARVCKSGL